MARKRSDSNGRIMAATCANWDGLTPSPAGALFKGEARNGDLTSANPQPEFSLTGTGSGTGQQDWTINGNGDLETEDINFELEIEKGTPHTASLTVESDNLSRSKTNTFNYITAVAIEAFVLNSAGRVLRAEWTSCDVNFYDANGDSVGLSLGDAANCELPVAEFPTTKKGKPNSDNKDRGGSKVLPGDNNRVRVVISGTFKLYATVLPLSSFSQVAVRAYVWVA